MIDPFPIWVTRWALSAGIETATAYAHPVCAEWVIVADGRFKAMVLTGDQWHASEDAARKWAERLRKQTVERDQKRLAELEAMTFEKGAEEDA